jgi:hypothetical protein
VDVPEDGQDVGGLLFPEGGPEAGCIEPYHGPSRRIEDPIPAGTDGQLQAIEGSVRRMDLQDPFEPLPAPSVSIPPVPESLQAADPSPVGVVNPPLTTVSPTDPSDGLPDVLRRDGGFQDVDSFDFDDGDAGRITPQEARVLPNIHALEDDSPRLGANHKLGL